MAQISLCKGKINFDLGPRIRIVVVADVVVAAAAAVVVVAVVVVGINNIRVHVFCLKLISPVRFLQDMFNLPLAFLQKVRRG